MRCTWKKQRKEINIYNRVGLGRYMDPVKRTTICSERIKGYEMLPADTFNKHLISAHYVSDHEGKKMNKKYFFPWRSSPFSGAVYCEVLKMSASDGLLYQQQKI